MTKKIAVEISEWLDESIYQDALRRDPKNMIARPEDFRENTFFIPVNQVGKFIEIYKENHLFIKAEIR